MPDSEPLSPTTWDGKYHVVFIPTYRRQALDHALRRHLGDVLRAVAEQKDCRSAAGHLLAWIFHKPVVLENNNGFLTQLLAEGLPLCRSLPESLSASVLVSCQEVGPGEPESAAVPSVRPSAW